MCKEPLQEAVLCFFRLLIEQPPQPFRPTNQARFVRGIHRFLAGGCRLSGLQRGHDVDQAMAEIFVFAGGPEVRCRVPYQLHTSVFFRLGLTERINAARAVTCGLAMEVPESAAYWLCG